MRPASRRGSSAARRWRQKGQKGYVAVLTALLLIPLLAMAAFAADVGQWYATGARLQRAADAAALAGVVWLPDTGRAGVEATKVLKQNGIDTAILLPGGTPRYAVDISAPTSERLRVTVTDNSAGRLFSQLLDSAPVVIIRSSVAEYIRPIPLGSPSNVYGNDPTGAVGDQPQFWASIAGPYYPHSGGDPYAARCLESPAVPPACTSPNPDYKPNGYFYAFDVPAGSAGRVLTVEVYDAGNYAGRADPPAGWPYPSYLNPFDVGDGRVSFQLLDEDSTPLSYDDNPGIPVGAVGVASSFGFAGFTCWAEIEDHADAGTWRDQWTTLCQVTVLSNQRVIYPLQVKTSNIPGLTDDGEGLNNFALRGSLSGGGGQVSVYATGQMPVFANPDTGTCASGTARAGQSISQTNFFLAEIPNQSHGKKVTISIFDPGDVSGSVASDGDFHLDVVVPRGAGFAGSAVDDFCSAAQVGELAPVCSYEAPRPSTKVLASSGCTVQVKWDGSAGPYNDRWVDITIDVPTNYDCETTGYGCWWRLRWRYDNLTTGTLVTDRTTYVVRVSGDPVRVIS